MTKSAARTRLIRVLLMIALALLMIPLGQSIGAGWLVEQLTDDAADNRDVDISGNNAVWLGHDGNDDEIVFYNGSTATTLTDNATDELGPQISGSNAVWSGVVGGDWEIFFYNGSTVTTLTDNVLGEGEPQISGNKAVWRAYDGNDNEIFFYNGSTVTTLTDNALSEYNPQISGNNAVWYGSDGNDYEIFFYNGSTVTTLTDNAYHDYGPQVSGGNAVWYGYDGNDNEIFFYNGSTVTTLTDNAYSDGSARISGNNVVWTGGDGSDNEIFFYNGSSVTTLTDNSTDDSNAWISGSNIVWSNHDAGLTDIVAFDGSTITTLTTSRFQNQQTPGPRVSGGNVVWPGWDGSDHEIFFAKLDNQAPTGSIAIKGGAAFTKARPNTLNLLAADTGGSSIDKMRFKDDGAPWTAWEPYSTSKSWTLPSGDGTKKVWAQFRDGVDNVSPAVFDTIIVDTQKPISRMVTPFVSTRISKTTTFKVKWSAEDPSPSSGLETVRAYYRPSSSSRWRLWKSTNKSGYAFFTGRAGTTYYFKTLSVDKARNWKWSKVYKTIVPFNEGIYRSKTGFFGYAKSGKGQNYLSSVRYSHTNGNSLIYKLYNNNGIGLIVTKGPNMGRAMIFVDGNYVTTVDAFSSKTRARQLIYYKGYAKKGTHWLWVLNLGTPGRAKFQVDGVVVGR